MESYHNCPSCYSLISDEFAHCPHCGAKQEVSMEGGAMPSEQPKPKQSPLLIVAVVAVVVLLLLGVGIYFFVHHKQEEPVPVVSTDSVADVVDSSLLYNDEYRQIDRSESYTIDLTPLYAYELEAGIEDNIPRSSLFKKELDLDWPIRLKGVKSIEQIQTAILAYCSEAKSVTIDDFVKGYFKKPNLDAIEGPHDLYDEIKLERCDAPDQCVQFKIERNGNNGCGTGVGSYSLIYYVAYDKTHQKLLTYPSVFVAGAASALVAQINREIVRINQKEEDGEHDKIAAVPDVFKIGRRGITFVISIDSPQYDLQWRYLEVTVPYNTLMPYLTKDFIQMIESQ